MLEQRGWSKNAAHGIAANAAHEAGGARHDAPLNPAAIGDNGNSFGLLQWNGPRRKALEAFATGRGKDWRDVNTRLDFLDDEVGRDFGTLRARMNGAVTAEDAARMFVTEFERPADLPTNLRVRASTARQLSGQAPAFSETAGAAFRQAEHDRQPGAGDDARAIPDR
ncbi:MAG: hypothetical protein IPK75_19925 [Acidobacteria bacterium]|nr:hypothetical protein [Acidobacteriota bacterium]